MVYPGSMFLCLGKCPKQTVFSVNLNECLVFRVRLLRQTKIHVTQWRHFESPRFMYCRINLLDQSPRCMLAGGRTCGIDWLYIVLTVAGPLWETMSDFILVLLLVVLLVCLIGTIGGFLLYSGLLSGVTINTGPPPIRNVTIAYKFKEGSYKDCGAAFTESCSIGPKLSSIGVFYDDPKQVRPQDSAPLSLNHTALNPYLNLTSWHNYKTQCTLFPDKICSVSPGQRPHRKVDVKLFILRGTCT